MRFVSKGFLSRCISVLLLLSSLSFGQQATARARITVPVDDTKLTVLPGNRHPLARPQFDAGAAPDQLSTRRMLLLLSRSPEQEAALDQLVKEQHTPGSANYHHWLTPAEFGQRFGPADVDLQTITGWLQQQGFAIERLASGKNVIEFSGTAGQVRRSFHTSIHKYVINGQEYWANAEDPKIPAALSPAVRGVVSLNNFGPKPLLHQIGPFSRDRNGVVTPAYTVSSTSGTYYAVGPADFATIYNTNPLLQSNNNGTGQTIAILGRSKVNLQDIADFRNLFGLGRGNTSIVIDGPDPGIVPGEESESVLDLEWANAVAPGASVILVSAQNTETTNGLFLAALHVIENNLASVMSLSYGTCEAHLGTTGNQYVQSLWEQAAAQGITVVVASGDSGSAGCDNQDVEYVASAGVAVSGYASTDYNVAVGGTDFDDAGAQSSYWSATNNSTTRGSALSYIPETTWNQSCAATASAGNLNVCPAMPSSGSPPPSLNLLAGSGGASNCTASTSSGGSVSCQSGRAKPSWQTGAGVPADGVRDLPDVALYAAAGSSSKSFYVVCEADLLPPGYPSCQPSSSGIYFIGAGGTSAAAPSFAGIVALAEQKAGARLGNLNYLLYSLAAGAGASCSSSSGSGTGCLFNDIGKGNNSVPCQAGSPNCSQSSGSATGVIVDSSQSPAYSAAAGYDLATGLGSVNAANLATAIANAVKSLTSTSTTLTLNGGTAAVTAQHGTAIAVGVNVSPADSSGDISLIGNSGGIDSHTLSGGAASWTSSLFPGGTYTVNAHYPGDGAHGASDSNGVAVTITPEPSQPFVNLVTFGSSGIQSFMGNNVPYGSPYLLRVDVTDSAGSVSATQGVSSKCSTQTASCPTGTVSLTANGSQLDAGSYRLNSKGFTEDQGIQLAAGNYTLAASYSGDSSYNASSGSSSVTIIKAPTTLMGSTAVLPPYQYGDSFQIDASLTTTSSGAAPNGTISWFDNGAPAGSDVEPVFQNPQSGGSNGYAKLTYSGRYAPPSLGTHTLYAQYSGDGNYVSSSSASFSINVDKANTFVESWGFQPTAATPTIPISLSITIFTNSVLAQPTGTITFYDNGTPITGSVTYGGQQGSWGFVASLTGQLSTFISQLGNHDITATYSGDANYNGVSKDFGTLPVYSKLPVNFNGASSSMNPALVNYPTNLNASVASTSTAGTPTPTGTFAFFDNGQPLSGTITYNTIGSSLRAVLPYTFTTTGAHSITATYSGDSNYASGSSAQALALSVTDKLPTTIPYLNLYGAVVNQPTSLSLDVNSNYIYNGPPMTGTVSFSDGSAAITNTVTYDSQQGYLIVSVPYTFTTPGTHTINVQYSGDSHYAASSNSFTETIEGLLALSFQGRSSVTMPSSGGTGSVNLAVTNNTNAPETVTLTCTSDSSAASCSVTPASQSVPALSTNVAPNVNFTVPALTASVRHAGGFAISFVFAGVLAGLSLRTRKKHAVMLALLIAVTITMGSCGGGGGSGTGGGGGGGGSPSPKVYHFTVTGTSGSNSDTQVLTVTVQ